MVKLIPLIFIALISCKPKAKETRPCDNVRLPSADYKIISETENQTANNTNIKIKIYKRLDKDRINEIAAFLQCSRMKYDKIWVFYYLSNQDIDNPETMPYATSHCNPWVKVEINYDI